MACRGSSIDGQRRAATELRERLVDSERVEVVQTTPDHEARASDLFGRRSDKECGMTVYVSFIVAQIGKFRTFFPWTITSNKPDSDCS